MIDEDLLAGLLADHAERIPVPETAVDSLLAASPSPLHSSPTHRPRFATPRMLAATATVVLALGVIGGYVARANNGARTEVRATATRAPHAAPPTGRPAARPTSGVTRTFSRQAAPAPPAAAKLSASGVSNFPPVDASHIVRTATFDLRVARDGLGTTVGRVTSIAASAGGFVADAHTAQSATPATGTVTIRVPSTRYRATVDQLQRLGTVTGGGMRSIDIGNGDVYAFAQRSGRPLIDDRAYATITISVSEPGA